MEGESESDTSPKTRSRVILFHGRVVDVELTNYKLCFQFIRDNLVSNFINNFSDEDFIEISKNSKITKTVSSIQDKLKLETRRIPLIICSYGSHIQKSLSIIEIFKSLSGNHQNYKQLNKLSEFTYIIPGRNELLEQKINIPILIVCFIPTKYNYDELLLNGFTLQCI